MLYQTTPSGFRFSRIGMGNNDNDQYEDYRKTVVHKFLPVASRDDEEFDYDDDDDEETTRPTTSTIRGMVLGIGLI
jgi:hypothetical protein